MRAVSEDNYRRTHKSTKWNKGWPCWKTLDRRRRDTKASDMKGTNAQEDQNLRRAVVTGFHDDSTRHSDRNHNDNRNVNGTTSDQMSKQCQTHMHSCSSKVTKSKENEKSSSSREKCDGGSKKTTRNVESDSKGTNGTSTKANEITSETKSVKNITFSVIQKNVRLSSSSE